MGEKACDLDNDLDNDFEDNFEDDFENDFGFEVINFEKEEGRDNFGDHNQFILRGYNIQQE